MSRWRKEAFEQLPELRQLLQRSKGAYAFLGDLVTELDNAHDSKNCDLITRIYKYTKNCLHYRHTKDASTDIPTAAICSFFESLPKRHTIRSEIGRWFTLKEIEGLKNPFLYIGTESEYQEMVDSCKRYNE